MGKKILKTGLRVFDGAVTALLVALLACQGYVLFARTVLKQPNPTVFGFHSAVVLTGSMADAIRPEDFIVTRRQKSYAVGDIVTYTAGDTTVTHRIVEKTAAGFITKGDANNTPDGEIAAERILGRVVWILPGGGAVLRFLQSPLGGLCAVLGLGALVLLPARRPRKERTE